MRTETCVRASTIMALFLVAGLLSLAVLSAPVVEAKLSARIQVTSSWTPTKPEAGKGVTFTIHIVNKQAEPMMVTYIGVHMDWQATTAYYDSISSTTLTPNQGADFTLVFVVPADAKVGTHDYTIRIDYTVAGTPYSEKTDKASNFEVFEPVADDGGDEVAGMDPLLLVLGIGVPVILVLVIIIFIIKTRTDKRKKRSDVIRARSEPKDAVPPAAGQEATPGHPVAAVGVAASTGPVPQGGQGQVQPHAAVHQTTHGVQATATSVPRPPPPPPPPAPSSGHPTPMLAKPPVPTPMPARPPGQPQGITPMPSAPPQGRPQGAGAAVPMPAKPPTPFGVVRSPKQATPGEDTKAVPEGACGNCGAPVKGRVCTVCGARVM